MNLPFKISRIDRLGASVSFLCAIHCITSIALASASVCWGIRIHRQRRILLLFGAALFLILVGHGFASGLAEMALIVPGAALFVCGHLLNQHLCRSCERCSHH